MKFTILRHSITEELRANYRTVCLRIISGNPLPEAEGACEQHMVTSASGRVPVPWEKPQIMWGLRIVPPGSETAARVPPPNAAPCLYSRACCPFGWMFKSRHPPPSRLDVRFELASQRKKGQHFDTQLPWNGILMSRSKTWSPCSESRCLCSFHVITFH